MQDAQLSVTTSFPAANANVNTPAFDLGVIPPGTNENPQNSWRLGRFRINYPALATHISTSNNITFTLQDALVTATQVGTGATSTVGTYANTNPLIQASLPGVPTTGSAAGFLDLPIPPRLRGPVSVQCAVPTGDGTFTAFTFTVSWTLE